MPHILLIDDSIDALLTISELIGTLGYEVTTSLGGEDGLQKLAENSFDLVMTDIIMPGIDGISLIKHIHESYPSLPIVAISGGGITVEREDVLLVVERFVQSTLTKPTNRKDLDICIKKALQ